MKERVGEFRTLPAGGRAPALSQKNARTGRRSQTILSSHQAHQGAAISQVLGTKSRPEDYADEQHPGTLSPKHALSRIQEEAPKSP